MARNANWATKSSDSILYIECSNCKHKLSAKQVIFADRNITVCPFCKAKMNVDGVRFSELAESLEQ